MVSNIPHYMNEILCAQKNVFFEPGSLCHAFSIASSGKLRIKSIHKGRGVPVEDCC